jgi:hypothetical protein
MGVVNSWLLAVRGNDLCLPFDNGGRGRFPLNTGMSRDEGRTKQWSTFHRICLLLVLFGLLLLLVTKNLTLFELIGFLLVLGSWALLDRLVEHAFSDDN